MVATVSGQGGIIEIREFLVPEKDLSGGGTVESAKNIEERRFSAARRAEQDHDFPLAKFDIDTAQGPNLIAVGFI